MKENKNSNDHKSLQTLESAIIAKFPNVAIHEMRHTKFGTRVLGVIPAADEYDSDHIIDWDENGSANECRVSDRDYREVGWDDEQQKPVYVKTKILLHSDHYSVRLHGTD